MARTISDIKKDMTDSFIRNETIKTAYELEDNKTFDEQFPPVSLEAIIFYTVAAVIWVLENLFDLHKREVDTMLSEKKPLRLKWYRDKTLAFQKDYILPDDSDIYATIDETARVVKYAVAVEPPYSSRVLIKIAGGESLRDKLPDDIAVQVYNYIQRIKGPGVRIDIVNQSPDYFKCEIDIYYDGMLTPANVEQAVRDAINNHIENLQFNGEFSNMALIDVLQNVEGVIIPELLSSASKSALTGFDFVLIDAKSIPDAGYFRVYNKQDVIINMKPYEMVQD